MRGFVCSARGCISEPNVLLSGSVGLRELAGTSEGRVTGWTEACWRVHYCVLGMKHADMNINENECAKLLH